MGLGGVQTSPPSAPIPNLILLADFFLFLRLNMNCIKKGQLAGFRNKHWNNQEKFRIFGKIGGFIFKIVQIHFACTYFSLNLKQNRSSSCCASFG